ncbi:intracellular hyaluronan-binding protein 4 isoform X2 [Hyla sarda]|uniref:intracellular hyaluronan-binding protein 4 isoform X2 n=1 Tax=Hyla sarda TaxID=327740 RepID=UPI0024C24A1B|nr:intracellular hyaluronan-binding protein 4 isoform X2 [Hyla sarda]
MIDSDEEVVTYTVVYLGWGQVQAVRWSRWSGGCFNGGMKPVQGSPVSSTMQEAFGCAVENRFFQLLDDESDPLDYLYQASSELGRKKEEAAKKPGNQKSNRKESQKDRRTIVVANTEAPAPKQAPKQVPKQFVPKVPQNENSGSEVKVERSERRAVFREFRPNVIEKPLEYSIDDFEKEKQVRNWVANQRGGMRGRGRGGFPRNMENDQRGKREFERHSGSDRTRIRAEDKRGGGGPRNWGSFKDACSDVDPTPVENVEAMEPVEATEEEQDIKLPEDNAEDYVREMSLDEWKSIQDQSRPKVELNLRKPDPSVLSKATVIHKSKYKNNSKEDDEDYSYGFRRPVNDITSQLDINFGSLPRPGRGGRGGGRGRGSGRREETLSYESHNVHEFVLNPDDPNDFPALI